jgi:hypothetical protein
VAREQGWEVVRFETLGRRLKLLGAIAFAALAGSASSAFVRRRRPARRVGLPRRR